MGLRGWGNWGWAANQVGDEGARALAAALRGGTRLASVALPGPNRPPPLPGSPSGPVLRNGKAVLGARRPGSLLGPRVEPEVEGAHWSNQPA